MLQRIDLADRVSSRARGRRCGSRASPSDTLVRDALERLAPRPRASSRAGTRGSEKQDPRRGGPRRRQLRRRDRAPARERDPRRAARAASPARARGGARRRRPVLPHVGSAARRPGPAPSSRRSTCPRTTGSSCCSRTACASPRPADVYARLRRRGGADGFDERRARLSATLGRGPARRATSRRSRRTTSRPRRSRNELRALGAFRADVSGAGPAVYGLFLHRAQAAAAERDLRASARTWSRFPLGTVEHDGRQRVARACAATIEHGTTRSAAGCRRAGSGSRSGSLSSRASSSRSHRSSRVDGDRARDPVARALPLLGPERPVATPPAQVRGSPAPRRPSRSWS